jgi:hypothetical protein
LKWPPLRTKRTARPARALLAQHTLKDAVEVLIRTKENNQRRTGKIMSLVTIVVTLIVVGVLLWLVNTYIPMDGKVKKILNIVVVVVVVLWLLNVFGVLGHLRDVRVSNASPAVAGMASESGLLVNTAQKI